MTREGEIAKSRKSLTRSTITDMDVTDSSTHIPPLAEVLGGVPLQLLVPLVAHDGRAAPREAPLGDVDMVALHPLGPVASVAAVYKASALQEKGGPGHHGSFLQGTN